MRLSYINFLAAVVTVAEGGTTGLRAPAKQIEDATDAAAAATDPALEAAASPLEDESVHRVLDKKKKKKRRKKNRKKKDDDDTTSSSSSVSGGGDRVEMYCKDSFEWQGRDKCKDYCLTYSGCKSGASIRIKDCGGKNQRWKKTNGGLKAAGCSGDLYLGDGELRKGRVSLDFKSGEIRRSGKCLTQMHHPRDGEPVEFRSCEKARRSDTNEWRFK